MQTIRYIIVVLLLLLSSFIANAQPLVSIDNGTISVTPSYTIFSADTYTVTGSVKNVSTVSFTNNVHVNVAIDTSSTLGVPKYYWRTTRTYSMISLAANATFPFIVSDVASVPNAYRADGGGITVVVWTSIGILPNDSTTTKDSVFTTIYVLPMPIGINDSKWENASIHIQNPTNSVISFNCNNDANYEVELFNTEGVYVLKQHINKENAVIATENLAKGLYYLKLFDKEKNKTFTKKVIIQ